MNNARSGCPRPCGLGKLAVFTIALCCATVNAHGENRFKSSMISVRGGITNLLMRSFNNYLDQLAKAYSTPGDIVEIDGAGIGYAVGIDCRLPLFSPVLIGIELGYSYQTIGGSIESAGVRRELKGHVDYAEATLTGLYTYELSEHWWLFSGAGAGLAFGYTYARQGSSFGFGGEGEYYEFYPGFKIVAGLELSSSESLGFSITSEYHFANAGSMEGVQTGGPSTRLTLRDLNGKDVEFDFSSIIILLGVTLHL